MSISTKVWKLEGERTIELSDKGFDVESQMEEILFLNFSLLSSDWLLIGRQVYTGFGYIDLLAIDRNGDLIVLELKKDRTPRDVISQALDYGSWIQNLKDVDIAEIYLKFQESYFESDVIISLDQKFEDYFNSKLPLNLNSSHLLAVVAGSMDESSERIVDYLSTYHEVNINFVLLRTFSDGERKYITKTWHADPFLEKENPTHSAHSKWNGHYYVSFGDGASRNWEDAVKYGFVSAGGGEWYSRTLSMLKVGDRIWVNIPKIGYVGTGLITSESVPIEKFNVVIDKQSKKLNQLQLNAPNMFHDINDLSKCEYVVGVKWLNSVGRENSVSEAGLFGNQNTVCRPHSPKWEHTVKRLSSVFEK